MLEIQQGRILAIVQEQVIVLLDVPSGRTLGVLGGHTDRVTCVITSYSIHYTKLYDK